MKLAEIASPDTRLFAKSEFGPASDQWPALSFSSRKIASDFAAIYRQDRDFVVYVGTGDPEKTEKPEHRQRLLSVLTVEPRAPISTRELVPAETWKSTIRRWGNRREWSLPITTTYDVAGFPLAREKIPLTYRSLGNLPSLGRCVPVQQTEYQTIFDLGLNPVALDLGERAQVAMRHNKELREELTRLVELIKQDVARATAARTGVYPVRNLPNDSDIFTMLLERWKQQEGICTLCDRPIPLKPPNKLFQMSRDRTVSANKTYAWENTRLTHLACNLGKSDATLAEWQDYLTLIRSGIETEDHPAPEPAIEAA
jgi:hypothetical protein